MKRRRRMVGVWPAILVGGLAAGAGEPALTGRQIAAQVYSRDDGKDSHSKFEMILVDKNGGERKRSFEIMSKDNGDRVNTHIEFTAPADIAGTKFLTLEQKGADDLQYLFLPALGRARRIAGGQKDQSFVNTEFTYEDLTRRQPEKDNQKLIKEEAEGGFSCYVLESAPVSADNSQYGRTLAWVDKKTFVAVRVDFFDKQNELGKRLIAQKLELKSNIWTVMELTMENPRKKTRTTLRLQDIQYNQGVDDNVFTVRRLEEKN